MNKTLNQVLIYDFYRRNYLFFFVCISLLCLIFRPPTLLMSPLFIYPMFESPNFFWGTMALLLGYYLKASYELWKGLRQSSQRFLLILGSYTPLRLASILMPRVLGVWAPAGLYAILIAGYSIGQGTWHVYALGLIHLGLALGFTTLLLRQLYMPREKVYASLWNVLIPRSSLRNSLILLKVQHISRGMGWQFWVTKATLMLIFVLVAWDYYGTEWNRVALYQVFAFLSCLQVGFTYLLRRQEEQMGMFWYKLPFRWDSHLKAYGIVALLLFLPETWGWIIFSASWEGVGDALSYWVLGSSIFMGGIALLYYRPYTPEHYFRLAFLVFCGLFLALLWRLPLLLLAGFIWGYSIWIFASEYHHWEPGSLKQNEKN